MQKAEKAFCNFFAEIGTGFRGVIGVVFLALSSLLFFSLLWV